MAGGRFESNSQPFSVFVHIISNFQLHLPDTRTYTHTHYARAAIIRCSGFASESKYLKWNWNRWLLLYFVRTTATTVMLRRVRMESRSLLPTTACVCIQYVCNLCCLCHIVRWANIVDCRYFMLSPYQMHITISYSFSLLTPRPKIFVSSKKRQIFMNQFKEVDETQALYLPRVCCAHTHIQPRSSAAEIFIAFAKCQ